LIQSVPFVAAATLATVERTRLNEFAYWQTLDARVTELLPWRPTPVKVTVQPEKQPELIP
jgi:hypothetical protein